MEYVDLTQSQGEPLNILLYGSPGAGKTRFSGTVGKELYTLFIDSDMGTKTLRQLDAETLKNVVVIKLTQFKDINTIYQLLVKNDVATWNRHFEALKIPIKVAKPFEAVILDSLTELQRVGMGELKKGDPKAVIANIVGAAQLQIQDWGKLGDFMTMVIMAFRELPITFIATAHQQLLKDDLSGGIFGLPNLKGRIAYDISQYFDIVGHMTKTQDKKYAMVTVEQQRWYAKTRIPLPEIMVSPTYSQVHEVNNK